MTCAQYSRCSHRALTPARGTARRGESGRGIGGVLAWRLRFHAAPSAPGQMRVVEVGEVGEGWGSACHATPAGCLDTSSTSRVVPTPESVSRTCDVWHAADGCNDRLRAVEQIDHVQNAPRFLNLRRAHQLATGDDTRADRSREANAGGSTLPDGGGWWARGGIAPRTGARRRSFMDGVVAFRNEPNAATGRLPRRYLVLVPHGATTRRSPHTSSPRRAISV